MSSGASFQDRFRKSAEKVGMCYRIPDSTYIGMRNGMASLCSRKSPADFFWFVSDARGMLHALLIEAKACRGRSIPFSSVADHQRESLLAFDSFNLSSHGMLALNFYGKTRADFDDVYLLPIGAFIAIEAAAERKSLTIDDCRREGILCPKAKGGIYDMSPVVAYLGLGGEKR